MFTLPIAIGIAIIFVSFALELMDSSIGMGYGTTLTPILLLLGFLPLQVVPAILLSEFFTGLFAGFIHHQFGNANFGIIKSDAEGNPSKQKMTPDLKTALIIGACSCVGAVIGAFVAISLPSFYLKLYIGVLITALGIYILIFRNKKFNFSWNKLTAIGLVASFNKAISGGGFGPVVTGGQILAGVKTKSAIAITSLAEALACVAGLSIYIMSNTKVDWSLFPYLFIGGMVSVPLSGMLVKRIKTNNIVLIVSIAIIALGVFTLYKIL